MSACTTTLGCVPLLKQYLTQLGDTHQAYCNTYKTHAMATHHGGAGLPLDRDPTLNGKNTDANIAI